MYALLLTGGLLFSSVVFAEQGTDDKQNDQSMPPTVSDESRADSFVLPVRGSNEEGSGKRNSPSLVQEEFHMLDVNNDNQISRQEAGAKPDLANIFDEVAGNKEIDAQEYAGWIHDRKADKQ